MSLTSRTTTTDENGNGTVYPTSPSFFAGASGAGNATIADAAGVVLADNEPLPYYLPFDQMLPAQAPIEVSADPDTAITTLWDA